MKKELMAQIRELVDDQVYETVDNSTDLYVRLSKIQDGMNKAESAGAFLKKNLDPNNWTLVIQSRNNNILRLDNEDILAPLIIETLKQLMDLLEAIHYSERKQTIIDFNNSLKECNDGKNTEK